MAQRQRAAVHCDGNSALRARTRAVPITTPAYSPQSNGLAEAFVGTVKRDYVAGAELRDAESVLAQLASWFDDYNTQAPHSALGLRSPRDYRAAMLTAASATTTTPAAAPHLPQDARSAGGPPSGYPPKAGWTRSARAVNVQLPT